MALVPGEDMELRLHHGDVLDVEADVLICSANVSLNLSGGVGGALMGRYGEGLQQELHGHLPTEPTTRPDRRAAQK